MIFKVLVDIIAILSQIVYICITVIIIEHDSCWWQN